MFEWDDEKNLANIEKHGIDFDTAKRIFEGQTLTIIDDRFDYGEVREISIGMVDGIAILTVAHTDREDKIRIISARRANQKERAHYEQEIL